MHILHQVFWNSATTIQNPTSFYPFVSGKVFGKFWLCTSRLVKIARVLPAGRATRAEFWDVAPMPFWGNCDAPVTNNNNVTFQSVTGICMFGKMCHHRSEYPLKTNCVYSLLYFKKSSCTFLGGPVFIGF